MVKWRLSIRILIHRTPHYYQVNLFCCLASGSCRCKTQNSLFLSNCLKWILIRKRWRCVYNHADCSSASLLRCYIRNCCHWVHNRADWLFIYVFATFFATADIAITTTQIYFSFTLLLRFYSHCHCIHNHADWLFITSLLRYWQLTLRSQPRRFIVHLRCCYVVIRNCYHCIHSRTIWLFIYVVAMLLFAISDIEMTTTQIVLFTSFLTQQYKLTNCKIKLGKVYVAGNQIKISF